MIFLAPVKAALGVEDGVLHSCCWCVCESSSAGGKLCRPPDEARSRILPVFIVVLGGGGFEMVQLCPGLSELFLLSKAGGERSISNFLLAT